MCIAILTTPKQIAEINAGKSNLKCRANVLPVLKAVPSPVRMTIGKEKIVREDGKKVDKFTYGDIDLSIGQTLMGVIDHGDVEFKNMSPDSMTVQYTEADGTTAEKVVLAGETATGFFEGTCVICYIPATEDRSARARIGFDRQVLSNFCRLYAIPIPVAGSETGIEFLSVEAAFQMVKAMLTRNAETLKGALSQKKPGDLKAFMNKATGIPEAWFKSIDGEKQMAHAVMEYLQAWAATCPVRHAILVFLISTAKGLGASIESISIHEHNEDPNYGTSCLPSDFRPLFDSDFAPKGDVFGRAITAVARKVDELGTHEAYVAYFKANYAPIFALEEEEEEIPTLGARLASEVDLEQPEGRTGSYGRTLSC